MLARELDVDEPRGRDPLTLVRDVSAGIYRAFEYVRKSTAVNSPIEASLGSRQGVCQDFAHIMIAVVRGLRIPCRYVSGYLYHGDEHHDRSAEGATHAWVEALLPGLGWVGFDPDQQPDRRRAPHPHRGRPRLRGRPADARHDEGPRRNRAAGPRPRHAVADAAAARRGLRRRRGVVAVPRDDEQAQLYQQEQQQQ